MTAELMMDRLQIIKEIGFGENWTDSSPSLLTRILHICQKCDYVLNVKAAARCDDGLILICGIRCQWARPNAFCNLNKYNFTGPRCPWSPDVKIDFSPLPRDLWSELVPPKSALIATVLGH